MTETKIAQLLNERSQLLHELDAADARIVEAELLSRMDEAPDTTARAIADELAAEHGACADALWEGLCAFWEAQTGLTGDATDETFNEALGQHFAKLRRRAKRGMRRANLHAAKARRMAHRAGNSKIGKAVRRVASSGAGRTVGGIVASAVLGI